MLSSIISLTVLFILLYVIQYNGSLFSFSTPLLLVLLFFLFFLFSSLCQSSSIQESFSNPIPYFSRVVHYGDEICLWTEENKYITLTRYGNWKPLTLTGRTDTPERPSSALKGTFIIERKNQGRGQYSQQPVRYGDKVYLRTLHFYMAAHKNAKMYITRNRVTWETFTIESENEKSDGDVFEYGDMFRLKTHHNSFVGVNFKGRLRHAGKIQRPILQVFDVYGNGQEVDWARRGEVEQGPHHRRWSPRFPAHNAIDGNPTSFNHTSWSYPYLRLKLPHNIMIERIEIVNRPGDTTVSWGRRLRDFDLTIENEKKQKVWSLRIDENKKEYTISNIHALGRFVQIKMDDTNRPLHIGALRVFGRPIQPNYLSEQKVSSNVITKPIQMTKDYVKRIGFNNLVPMGQARSYTLSFFLQPEEKDPTPSGTLMYFHMSGVFIHIENGIVQVGRNGAKAKEPLQVGTWNHVGLIMEGGVSPTNGWFPVRVPGETQGGYKIDKIYIVHSTLRRYYHVKTNDELVALGFSTDTTEYPAWTKERFDQSPHQTKLEYMGELTRELNRHMYKLKLYINGSLVDTWESNNSWFTDKGLGGYNITLGSGFGTASILIDRLTVYNYDLPEHLLVEQSKYRMDNLQIRLTEGETKADTMETYPFHKLPTISNGYSIFGWIRTKRHPESESYGKRESFLWKGENENDNHPGLWFEPNSNQLQVYVSPMGRLELGQTIPPNEWTHVGLSILEEKTIQFYVNGELVGVRDVSQPIHFGTAPLHIGGFSGVMRNVTFTNFVVPSMKDFMGVHPNLELQDKMYQLWSEVGCENTPEWKEEWIQQLLERPDELKATFEDIYNKAQAGNPEAIELCYGTYAKRLSKQVEAREKELKERTAQFQKKCLPTAPYFQTGKVSGKEANGKNAILRYKRLVERWQEETGEQRVPTPQELEQWIARKQNEQQGETQTTTQGISPEEKLARSQGKPNDLPLEVWKELDEETRRGLASGTMTTIPLENIPPSLLDKVPKKYLTQQGKQQGQSKQQGQQKQGKQQKQQTTSTTCPSIRDDPFSFVRTVLQDKMGDDPRYKAMMLKMMKQLMKKDPQFAQIVKSAKQNGWEQDKEYKELVQQSVEDELIQNKTQRRLLLDLIKEKQDTDIQRSLQEVSEDELRQSPALQQRPDYQELLREMKQECSVKYQPPQIVSPLDSMTMPSELLQTGGGGNSCGLSYPLLNNSNAEPVMDGGAMTFYGRWA